MPSAGYDSFFAAGFASFLGASLVVVGAAADAIVEKSRMLAVCPDSSIIFAMLLPWIAVVAVFTIGWKPTYSNSSTSLLSIIISIFFSESLTML